MTWKDKNGGDHTNNDHKEFKPIPPFQYNGQKSGSYNATSKKIPGQLQQISINKN